MIVVTGGTGFVGSYLLLQLATTNTCHHPIRALYRKEEHIQKTKSIFDLYQKTTHWNKIEWVQADILELQSLETVFQGANLVYHCAGLVSFDRKDYQKLIKTNIEGTANVVNFCLAANVNKCCFISSIAALNSNSQTKELLTEQSEWNPEVYHSDYAISKHGAEMEVWRGQQEGLQVVILNPGVILGAITPTFNQTSGSHFFFYQVKKGLRFYTQGKTGFVSVTDVAKVAVLAMNSEVVNQQFIVVSENWSYQKTLFAIADALQVKRPRLFVNAFWMRFLAKADWLLWVLFKKNRALTTAVARASTLEEAYSNKKIINTLKFQFTDLTHCIEEVCRKITF